MKATCFLAMFTLGILLYGCAAYDAGGNVQAGINAMLAGDNQTALSYFQTAAQQDPNYIYGTQLRHGVFSYLGRAQYLNKDYNQARQTLEKVVARNSLDTLALLYLGLTQVRLEDRQAGVKNIEASMKKINSWIDYLNKVSPDNPWDPGEAILTGSKNALAMISSGNIDWSKLLFDGESVGIGMERQEQTFRQQFIDSTDLWWNPDDPMEKSPFRASTIG
jgi:tetratricopeptide (TPR) repeat protein